MTDLERAAEEAAQREFVYDPHDPRDQAVRSSVSDWIEGYIAGHKSRDDEVREMREALEVYASFHKGTYRHDDDIFCDIGGQARALLEKWK